MQTRTYPRTPLVTRLSTAPERPQFTWHGDDERDPPIDADERAYRSAIWDEAMGTPLSRAELAFAERRMPIEVQTTETK